MKLSSRCPKCGRDYDQREWWYNWPTNNGARAVLRCPCGHEWERRDYVEIKRPVGVK